MNWKVLILLIPTSLILSFMVYRISDEKLSDRAQVLSIALPQYPKALSRKIFRTDLSRFKENLCASKISDSKSRGEFVQLWEAYQTENREFFKDLLEARIQTPVTHSAKSISGHLDEMSQDLAWIRHFEHHICYLELTGKNKEAVKLLKVFMNSVLKSFEFAQPFAQNIQSLRLPSSALYELAKNQTTSDLESQIQKMDAEMISDLSYRFHFQSVINSIENLKDHMKLEPKVYLPILLIQPGRLKNQMANLSMDTELKVNPASPQAAWYDVRNLELIYLSLFQKSVQGQKEKLETELSALKELTTDLGRKTGRLENDKVGGAATK